VSLAGAFWSVALGAAAPVSVLVPLVPCAPVDWSVLEGVVLLSAAGGVAFWSDVLVLLLLVEVPEDVDPLLVWASATAPESTRIAMMLSVLFITYLVRDLTAPLPSIIRRS